MIDKKNINDNVLDGKCCETCGPSSSNIVPTDVECQHECCEGFKCVDFDPSKDDLQVCLALIERVFDCIILPSPTQFRSLNLPFKVITNGDYTDGDPVCIEKVGLGYDCIGLNLDPTTSETFKGYINSKEVNFMAEDYSAPLCVCSGEYIYNKFKAVLPMPVYCCDGTMDEGVKVRVSEPDLDFYVCNLKIVIEGRIGCPEPSCNHGKPPYKKSNAFIAEFEYSGPLSKLAKCQGLKTLDFYGQICVPTAKSNVVLNEEFFDATLDTDCAIATSNYHEKCDGYGGFNADVLFCYSIKKEIYTLVKEKKTVLSTKWC